MDLTLLKKTSDIDSVSGDEKLISTFLKSEYQKLADEVIYDNLGSIFAVKKAKKKNAQRVMVVGHMDESGFIVKKINNNGTLKVLLLGHLEKNSLLGASVRLKINHEKYINGTIVSLNENGEVLSQAKECIVDFGFCNSYEAIETGVRIGNRVSFSTSMEILANGNRILMKNWDGRYAPMLGIEILKSLEDVELDFDLYVGCTVQEQVGFRGVQTATNVVKPDLGIILDTNQAFDYQENVTERIGILGEGLLINFYDTSVLPNRLLIKTLKNTCEQHSIQYQYYYSLEGSDAAWVNKLRTGTPTLFVNVPVRNVGTPSSILDVRDFESAKAALLLLLQNITDEDIISFKEENR